MIHGCPYINMERAHIAQIHMKIIVGDSEKREEGIEVTHQSSGLTASGSPMYSGSSSSQPSGFTASSSAILAGASSSLWKQREMKDMKVLCSHHNFDHIHLSQRNTFSVHSDTCNLLLLVDSQCQ